MAVGANIVYPRMTHMLRKREMTLRGIRAFGRMPKRIQASTKDICYKRGTSEAPGTRAADLLNNINEQCVYYDTANGSSPQVPTATYTETDDSPTFVKEIA